MAALVLDGMAVALSNLWLLCALPFHTLRLARIRLRAHLSQVGLAVAMESELKSFRKAIQVAEKMEHELEEMDLTFQLSSRAMLAVFKSRMRRLRQRAAESLAPDIETVERDGPDSESSDGSSEPRPIRPYGGPESGPGHDVHQEVRTSAPGSSIAATARSRPGTTGMGPETGPPGASRDSTT